jgi:hypothetical protein
MNSRAHMKRKGTAGHVVIRYPWSAWFERASVQNLVLVQHLDFACQVHSMNVLLRNAARRLGYKITLSIQGERIKVKTKVIS